MKGKNRRKDDQNFWNFFSSIIFVFLLSTSIILLEENKKLHRSIPVFDFFILVLATFRLIRLFTYDSVMSYIRNYFKKFEKGPGKTVWKLLDCPWCTGVWMAWIALVLYLANDFFWYFLLVLAISGLATSIQIIIWKIDREA